MLVQKYTNYLGAKVKSYSAAADDDDDDDDDVDVDVDDVVYNQLIKVIFNAIIITLLQKIVPNIRLMKTQ